MPPLPLGRLGADGGARLRQARLALVAGRCRDQHGGERRRAAPAIIAARASRAAPTARSPRPISPTGRRAIAAASSCAPNCVAQRDRHRRRPRDRRALSRRRRPRVAAARRPVVVAGNGIGTARLLLASGIDSPALGRNLMFHPGRLCARHVRGRAGRSGGAGRLRGLQPRILRDRCCARLQARRASAGDARESAADPGGAPGARLGRRGAAPAARGVPPFDRRPGHGRGSAGGAQSRRR